MKPIHSGTAAFAAGAIILAAFSGAAWADGPKQQEKTEASANSEQKCYVFSGCAPHADGASKKDKTEESAKADEKCYVFSGCVDVDKVAIDKTTTSSITKSADTRPYGTVVAKYAAAYGVPLSLAHAVIRIESNYRANARGSHGEIGLMQIKPATARMMGYAGSNKGLYDPATNIKFGMKYLGMAQKLGGGSTCGTILKYNAGHAARRMNSVSSAYCSKIKRSLAG